MRSPLAILLAIATTAEAKPQLRPPPISVRIHDVVVTGALARGVVIRTLQEHQAKFHACFEQQAYDPRTTKERLAVGFEIAPKGRVTKVDTKGLDGVAPCTRNAIDDVVFGKPSDGRPVQVRLLLSVEPA